MQANDMSRKERRQESYSPLEELRMERTELTQDEFVFRCGFARATYQRWVRGATPIKPTPEQILALCRLCSISPKTLFQRLGFDTTGVPDDLPSHERSLRSDLELK